LSQLFESEGYDRFNRRFEITITLESRDDLVETAKSLGLVLTLDEDIVLWGRVAKGTRASLAQIVDRLVCRAGTRVVLGKERVCVLSRRAAIKYWISKLSGK
jgi:hypothetical protein